MTNYQNQCFNYEYYINKINYVYIINFLSEE